MIEKVVEYQRRGDSRLEEHKRYNFPFLKNYYDKIEVECDPSIVADFAHTVDDNFLVRGTEQIRIMLQSSALSRGKKEVEIKDAKRLLDIAPYINTKMPYLGRPHDELPKKVKRPVGRPRKKKIKEDDKQ